MGNKNAYDANFKKIIRNKSLLAYTLKNFIKEYKDLSVEEIEELLHLDVVSEAKTNEVLALENEYNDETYGKIELDKLIGAKLPNGDGEIGILFNFEMQRNVKEEDNLLSRAIYYLARIISAQKNVYFTHTQYHKLKKVYSVWFSLIVERKSENSLTYYAFHEECKFGNFKANVKDYDKAAIVLIRMANEDSVDELDAFHEIFVRGKDSKSKLSYLRDQYGIDLAENEREVSTMLTPEEFFELKYKAKYKRMGLEEGRLEGRLEGRNEGRLEGRAEARAETRVVMMESVQNIMEATSLSLEEILKMLKISEEEKQILREKLTVK